MPRGHFRISCSPFLSTATSEYILVRWQGFQMTDPGGLTWVPVNGACRSYVKLLWEQSLRKSWQDGPVRS